MHIIIIGASGLIGRALVHSLAQQHQLTLIGRSERRLKRTFGIDHTVLSLNKLSSQTLSTADAVINLAGDNIGHSRWTASKKERILDSRVNTTTLLAQLACQLGQNSPWIINASAIGIYGPNGASETPFIETSALDEHPSDFLATVGRQWEAALAPVISAKIPCTILRFGVVLSCEGGMLKKLLPSFKCGLGAIIGDGRQMISWISIKDLVGAIVFILENNIQGVCNLTAPTPVSQTEFTHTLARCLNRCSWMRIPTPMVGFLFGEMGQSLLLQGIAVAPDVLQQNGFTFQYATLEEALKSLLQS